MKQHKNKLTTNQTKPNKNFGDNEKTNIETSMLLKAC